MKYFLELDMSNPDWKRDAMTALALLEYGAQKMPLATATPIAAPSAPAVPLPPPAAPIVNAAPPAPTNTPTGELDAAGAAWNPDQHSASKAKNKDGTWRTRRNLDTKKAATPPAVPTPPIAPPPPAPAAVPTPPAAPAGNQQYVDFYAFAGELSQWSQRTGKQMAVLLQHYGNGLSEPAQLMTAESGPLRDYIISDIRKGVHG